MQWVIGVEKLVVRERKSDSTLAVACEACKKNVARQDTVRAVIIGRERTVCTDCHDHLKNVW